MFEIFSMREPAYFSVWLLVYLFYFFSTARSFLGKKHWPVTAVSFLVSVLYFVPKFFENTAPVVIATAVAAAATSAITLIKKQLKPLKFFGSVIILNLLVFAVGCVIDVTLGLTLVRRYNLPLDTLLPGQNYTGVFYLTTASLISATLLISGIIRIFCSKKRGMLNARMKYIYFLWIPVTHIITFMLFYIVFYESKLTDSSLSFAVIAFLAVVFLLDIITFFIIEKFEKIELENKAFEEEIFKNKLKYQQIVMLNQNKKELNKIKHDMLNILSTVKSFVELDKKDKALGILYSATEDLNSLKGVPVCSNDTLNTILAVKAAQAKKENTSLKLTVNEESALAVDDYSLCRIIGNLADNAINAAKLTSNREIRFTVDIDENTMTVTTENSCQKTEKRQIDSENHGNGKRIIKEIVKKYGGSYTCRRDGSLYKTVTVLKNTNIRENNDSKASDGVILRA